MREWISRSVLATLATGFGYLAWRCFHASVEWSDRDGGFDMSGAKYPLLAGMLLMLPGLVLAAAALCDSRRWSRWIGVDRQTKLSELPDTRWVGWLWWFDWF